MRLLPQRLMPALGVVLLVCVLLAGQAAMRTPSRRALAQIPPAPLATSTATVTGTPPTATPTVTGTPPTFTPTSTPGLPTATPTRTPSSGTYTPTRTATTNPTLTPLNTATASDTATDTATPPPSTTPSPSPTSSPPPSPTSSGTPTPTPGAGYIAIGPGDQESPKVDGDIVVWEDNHSGNWDVLAKDLATNRVFTVTDGLADERYPDISGNLVVWQDARNGPWAIYGAQLSGDTAGPAFPISSGPGDQINPRVSGSQVVWQSSAQALATTTPQNAVRWDIVGTDLATGGQFTATTNTTTNFYPAIDRGIVVWQSIVPTITLQLPSGRGRWDILGYTIATGTAFTVAEDLNDKTNPDINGDLVVWQEYLGGAALAPTGRGRWGIHGHEISSGRTFTVTDDLDDQTNPAIVGSTVAYADSNPNAILAPLGRGRWAIDSADVTTGVTQTISTALTDATLPAIASSHIVWQQLSQAGDSDVYGNVCRTTYSDVTPGAYFYAPVQWFACSGMISGYGDGTFRPYNNTTRGQLAKIVVLSEAWPINTAGGPHFADVPPSNPFYSFVETAYQHGIISGYRCGGPGEPCDAQNHPYFRWGNEVTRGQIAKIIVGAAGWAIDTTGGPHFVDVPPGNPFYAVIETAYNRGIVSGYSDGTFRWVNNAIRGQIAKILYGALSQP